jgi:adenosine deaminase
MKLQKLPKIDLHCHLDGSLRPSTVLELLDDSTLDLNMVKENLRAPANCTSLIDYLKTFKMPIAVMQTKKNLERVSYELFEDAARENIKYLEVRFAPQNHTNNGLTYEEIIDSVLKGMRKAEAKYEIRGNYILSCMRHLSADSAMEVVEAGKNFINNGVVAIDLCGGEDAEFCQKFMAPIKKAKEYGYHITIHAGETGIGQNVADAIKILGAERIGHGIFITNSVEAYELVKENNIFLEVCPTSNIQTKAVANYKDHPIFNFYKDGIKVTLNTDNRTVSETSMTREIKEVEGAFNLAEREYRDIYLNSVEAAFISEEEKEQLRKHIDN